MSILDTLAGTATAGTLYGIGVGGRYGVIRNGTARDGVEFTVDADEARALADG